jgi:predicted P-loop ATPase
MNAFDGTPPGEPWTKHCIRDKWKRIVPNLANVMAALRLAPEIADIFSYDEMERRTIISEAIDGQNSGFPRPVDDSDVSRVQEFLQRNDMPRIGKDTTHQAVDLRARERPFHPVRDYLSSLKWDGTPRLDTWLFVYFGAEGDPHYLAPIGRMFLVSMVARIFAPGCKVDYMLVVEGDQGNLKSSACRVLAGGWFSDNLPDLQSGDLVRLSMHLRGKWLIEIGELASFHSADTERLKTFLSQREERFTPKFARKEVTEPRQCAFIGTTNKAVYLKDETGARRFWPFKATIINLAELARNRDQLFAEAVALYRGGAQWWPDAAFERAYIKPQQEARREVDAWQEPIAAYVASRQSVTPGEVARKALKIAMPRIATTDIRRITAVLVTLGLVRSDKKDVAGNYPYLRKEVAPR